MHINGFYLSIRHSFIHKIYSHLRYPSLSKAKQNENKLYTSLISNLLPGRPLIFDIGANIGDLTMSFYKCGASVVAIEPDQNNLKHLRFRIKDKNVFLEPVAVFDYVGDITFYQNKKDPALSSIFIQEGNKTTSVSCTTISNLIQKYGKPDFIKIDAEGSEKTILLDLTLPIRLLAFECNLPEFLDATHEILQHLIALSFKYAFNVSFNDATLFFDSFVNIDLLYGCLNSHKGKYCMVFCLNDI